MSQDLIEYDKDRIGGHRATIAMPQARSPLYVASTGHGANAGLYHVNA